MASGCLNRYLHYFHSPGCHPFFTGVESNDQHFSDLCFSFETRFFTSFVGSCDCGSAYRLSFTSLPKIGAMRCSVGCLSLSTVAGEACVSLIANTAMRCSQLTVQFMLEFNEFTPLQCSAALTN